MRASFTVDRKPSVRPAVVADARALPFQDAEAAGPLAFRWAVADTPYSREWARTLYGITARQYPTPGGIVAKDMWVLAPGGRRGRRGSCAGHPAVHSQGSMLTRAQLHSGCSGDPVALAEPVDWSAS